VTEETAKLRLPSRIEAIAGAADAAAEFARLLGFPEDVLFGIDLAVREAVANAVVHGNRQDESKAVEIGFTTSGAGLVVTVCDQPALDLEEVTLVDLEGVMVSSKMETYSEWLAVRGEDLCLIPDNIDDVKPVIERTYKLEDAAEALRHLIEGRPFGRVVLVG
jgi:anti-sigma regulatory factor (Ser/Thr protein kinase)